MVQPATIVAETPKPDVPIGPEPVLNAAVAAVAETPAVPQAEPAVAPLSETPAARTTVPTLVPAAVAPPATEAKPTIPPDVQQYITRLEEQTRQSRQDAEARSLEQAVTQYATKLEQEQGLAPEQAQFVAKREGQLLYQQYQAEQFRQGQFMAALDIGKEHGVDPRILIHLPTPDAMRAAAQAATSQNRLAAENAALKAENERLKKASVLPQTFASGAVSGDGGKPTKDNIDGLYLRDPERYGAVYRRFRETGEIS